MNLTTKEVAEKTNLHESYIRRLCNESKIAAEKKGRDWLIKESQIPKILNRANKRK